jgi:eukaryotic-like serine/threonine-protein kinase
MIGQIIGNYTVASLIGKGGMGDVYVALHPTIGRRVAIKVLRAELTRNQVLVDRFQRLKRIGPMPAPAAVDIALQATSALAAAHAKGIIHRDLKPENLFLMAGAGAARPDHLKVLDFGIAKLHGAMENKVRTKTGAHLGTPTYMSPEQCRGSRDIDPRSDIYALAVILHEALCGQPPFTSKEFWQLLNLHLYATPEPLRRRAPAGAVSESLERSVMKALSKRPEDRFQTMTELRDALLGRAAAAPASTGEEAPLIAPRGRSVRVMPALTETQAGKQPAPAVRRRPWGRLVAWWRRR